MITKVFFCTDIHGSTKCWRILVSAGEFYKADVVILGEDMTGKGVVPLIRHEGGFVTSSFLGRKWKLQEGNELEAHKQLIVDAGMYPYEFTEEGLECLKEKRERLDDIFKESR